VSDRIPRKTSADRPAASRAGRRWVAPAMLTCWLLGLLWVVVYYVAGDRIPVMDDLGGWNLIGGMSLVGLGFVFATQWE
jgi:hypothetical protein